MANQIIIDIGAAANDGTGDPLRTAFNYVNNNFSNVWNTGLPTSNVQFLDNKILTVNTNANLVLAPNGIGKVASNVDIVPNTANVFALGSPTRRWNTVYGQYLDLSHNATIGGNLVVTGNLSAGNISYTSNVFVGDLEGSVFDGASSIVLDVIDSSIYVDNYYYANGTPVSFGGGNGTPAGSNTQIQFNDNGVFGAQTGFNFNKATNNFVVPGNIINTTTATANLGSAGFRWNYLYTSNINASNDISASGNITGGYISASNVFVTNTITSTDCYITSGSFSGEDETGDNSLFVGHPTFTTLGTDIMAQFTGNVVNYAQINFQNYSNANTASGDYIITADNGNDSTHYLDMGMTSSTWDGSQTNVLDGLSPNNGYLYVQDGNLTLGVRNGSTSYTWKFDTAGNLTIAGNVVPTGNNTQSLGSPTQQWADLYVSNATIFMNNVPLSLNSSNVLTVNGADVVTTNANGQANIGNLDITGTYVSIAAGADETIITISPNIEGQAYLQIPEDATANVANVRLHNDAGNIELGTGSGSHNWYFGNTGSLTFPNGANIRTVDELTIINSTTTANGVIGINARESAFGDSVAQIYLDGTDRVARVSTYNPDTEIGYDWTFDAGGSFTVPTAPGNIYMGTNTNGPVILPTSLGIELNANRDDTTQDYISVSQDGIDLFSVHTINIDNSTTGFTNSDINLRSGDDILLQGRDKADDTEAEGGDINIWAGDGASSTGLGNDTGGGGDIQILGGLGGSGTGTGVGASAGGFISINAGDGGTSIDSNAGSGGSLTLSAGSAAGVANTALGGIGGSINISAGQTTRINEIGGSISLNTGGASGDGTSAAGYLEINIPSSNAGPGGTWTFGGTGTTLNVPGNAEIYGANFGNLTVGCAGNTIVTSSDYGANAQNWVFGYTGTLTFPSLANISGGNFNAGTASATVALNAFSPDGNTVSIQAQGNTSSAVISIFANSGPVTNNWTFTQAPLDPTEAFLYVPPGASISTPNATGGEGGKNIFIQAGASDPVTWNSNPGGELMLKGGYGSFGDGGGGPGGNVNISGGESSDSHAGNVNIASGLNTWVFDYSGVLTAPGNITSNIVSATNNDGTGRNIKVGDDTWLGDINISNTLSLRGQQDGTSGYIVFGNASNVKLGRVGTGPLRYEGDFEANGNITAGNNFQLPVYANTTVRDSSIASPSPGMMIYVTGTGMQVRGATSWNTIAGSGT